MQKKPTTYFLYCRKSTEDKERQILSLESQKEAMNQLAQKSRLKIIRTFEESKSAKEPNKRPIFAEMTGRIKRGEANGILCWKLDRLARNPDEAGQIIGMLQRGIIKNIKTYEKDYNPEDNSVISFVEFGIANQYSRDLSKNVKRGIDRKAVAGWRPGHAPLGYLNSKTNLKGEQIIFNDPERFLVVKQILKKMLSGNYTMPELLKVVNNDLHLMMPKTKSLMPHKLHLSELHRILINPFYYGWYEWPKESSNWFKGKHEPMITEVEFDQIQYLLGREGKPRPKTHKFAFTGLMRCGSCGAMITAEEKFKHQKNGNVHHYIYYRCTKKINPDCPERAIEVKELHEQIDQILEIITISERFLKWAALYIIDLRNEEVNTREVSMAGKEKEYEKIKTQLDNLLLKYTSPENANGQYMSEEEYLRVRSQLTKQKALLDEGLKAGGRSAEECLELTERLFNFAHYVRIWFENGKLEEKRAILANLGSNLRLKDKKLSLTLHKPLQLISERREGVEKEIRKFGPVIKLESKRNFSDFAQEIPVLSGLGDDVRNYFMETDRYFYVPAFNFLPSDYLDFYRPAA